MSELPSKIAAFVTRWPGAIVVVTLLLAVGVASQIPNIVRNPSPEDMIASFEDYEAIREAFEADFGNTDQIAVLLVEAPDITARPVLSYVHALTQHFESDEGVRRVDSITKTPITKGLGDGDDPDGDFDIWDEGDDGGELTLDALEDESEGDDLPQEVMDALLSLTLAAPVRFPGGLTDISERRRELEPRRAVEGDEVTDEDGEALSTALADLPLVTGRLVSEDRTVTAIALGLPTDHRSRRAVIEEMDTWLDANPPPEGVALYRGGLPYVRASIVVKMQRDNRVLLPLTLLVCAVLLFAAFRSAMATLLPLMTVGITAAFVVGGMAIVGQPMTILTNIVPPLLIIIGISDSIHLVGRYRDELRESGNPSRALVATVRSMATACFLTSLTTSIGIASLLVSSTVGFRTFAAIASIGVMVAYVVTITFLPAAIARSKGVHAAPPPKKAVLERFLGALTVKVIRRRWWVLGATVVVSAVAATTAAGLEVDHALMDQFDESDPVFVTTRLLEDRLEGVRPLEVSIRVEDPGVLSDPAMLQEIDRVAAWALTQDGVLGVSSGSQVLHEAWAQLTADPGARTEAFTSAEQVDALATLLRRGEIDALGHYLTGDGRHLRLRIMVADIGAQATMRLIDRLEGELSAIRERAEVALTGEAFTGSVGTEAVVTDIMRSLGLAILIIFVVLTVLFRSVRLGLLSIPPNLIPLIGTMAWMVVRGMPLNIATGVIFSISIGLAVDGTIHVLARFREEAERGLGQNVALVRAARGTGRAIVVSCVTLMLGFGVLLFSSFVPVRNFGELIAVTAFFCLLSTVVVQPALLRVGAGALGSLRSPESSG
ncbi:MAG: hypothetical protein DRJ42_11735 [Deltaproteobacteria bacterium]|nr:MAG: hypothetical protein DRJ42_11735 [Deltaproteobacteria bacterium]